MARFELACFVAAFENDLHAYRTTYLHHQAIDGTETNPDWTRMLCFTARAPLVTATRTGRAHISNNCIPASITSITEFLAFMFCLGV